MNKIYDMVEIEREGRKMWVWNGFVFTNLSEGFIEVIIKDHE